jgi:hypothetical protein
MAAVTGVHEILIVPDSAYSVGPRPNTGRRANLRNPKHYPVEAECSVCGLMVRREKPAPDQLDWMHLDRKPGEP